MASEDVIIAVLHNFHNWSLIKGIGGSNPHFSNDFFDGRVLQLFQVNGIYSL